MYMCSVYGLSIDLSSALHTRNLKGEERTFPFEMVLISKKFECIYAHLLLKVVMRVADISFQISYLYIDSF